MTVLSLDYETRSKTDLLKQGLQRYARCPSTRVLMAGYAIDSGPVEIWLPHESPKLPKILKEAFLDPHVEKRAWNCRFESDITTHVLGTFIPGWVDTMVCALYASLPAQLAQAGIALGLPEDMLKMAEGKKLIRLFCIPKADGTFNDHKSHPEQFELFIEYCKRDVVAEREIARRLAAIPPPKSEWVLHDLDCKINSRGIPIDMQFVEQAIAMGDIEKDRLLHILRRETRLPNPNTRAAFLGFAKDHGYPYNDLRAGTIAKAIRNGEVSDTLARLLELRVQAGKTSLAKYEAIQRFQQDGRVHNAMQFYGAGRTGRWAGRGVQVQNFPRPSREVEGFEEQVTDMIKAGDYDDLLMLFGGAMSPLSSLVRSSFRAPDGKVFYVSDLNAIENRVLGWVSGCKPILDVFRNERDPYKDFGARMFQKPYETITKGERTISKPAVLGCGYMLGAGAEQVNKNGDTVRTGLWGYAEAMGIEMTQEEAALSVKVFREAFPEVVQFWGALKEAAHEVVTYGGTIKVGKVHLNGDNKMLRIRLPNGRNLVYLNTRVEMIRRVFEVKQKDGTIKKESRMMPALGYDGVNTMTKKWGRQYTHGGKLTENICQAIARDVLAEGLIEADRMGFDIILHAHDEIVCEVDIFSELSVQDLADAMTKPLAWAEGLPLKAEASATPIYRK